VSFFCSVSDESAANCSSSRLGILPSLTGGDLIYIPKFDPVRAGGKLRATMEASIHREMGYNATMRIRCSTGSSALPPVCHLPPSLELLLTSKLSPFRHDSRSPPNRLLWLLPPTLPDRPRIRFSLLLLCHRHLPPARWTCYIRTLTCCLPGRRALHCSEWRASSQSTQPAGAGDDASRKRV
jgi:hypothetical protein